MVELRTLTLRPEGWVQISIPPLTVACPWAMGLAFMPWYPNL